MTKISSREVCKWSTCSIPTDVKKSGVLSGVGFGYRREVGTCRGKFLGIFCFFPFIFTFPAFAEIPPERPVGPDLLQTIPYRSITSDSLNVKNERLDSSFVTCLGSLLLRWLEWQTWSDILRERKYFRSFLLRNTAHFLRICS